MTVKVDDLMRRGRDHALRRSRAESAGWLRRVMTGPVLFSALCCLEPSYVSLGRNDEAVVAPAADVVPTPEAGAPDDGGPSVGCAIGPGSTPVSSACASRRVLGCSDAVAGDQLGLDELLSNLLVECGATRGVLTVRVEAGCATRFELEDATSRIAMDVGSCVALRLADERHACAERLECGRGAVFGIPTSSVEPDWH